MFDDAPHWTKYCETVIEKLGWMQEAKKTLTEKTLEAKLWHMHPVVFLDSLKSSRITLPEARVRAFMRLIRVCEGTTGEGGYERLFGGESFIKDYHKTFADHPRIKIVRKNKKTGKVYPSTAAGAYQVMGYTWDDVATKFWREKYNILDFSPSSQYLLCVVLLKEKVKNNALDMIINNLIEKAITESCSYEWASLPPSRHGQPIKSISECLSIYNKFFDEELLGKTDLHISNGFLRLVGYE
jgi:muramidase (phage lysozyme)